MRRYRSRTTRAGWAVVAIAALSAAVGVAVASDAVHFAINGASMVLLAASDTALGMFSERRASRLALEEERQRIARNLHDGLAQELAFIRMETQRMAAGDRGGRAARLAVAAERALEESRGAIDALRTGDGDPFHVQLGQLADELATRGGARVSLHIDPDFDVERTDRDALLRIMREAISNGVRHGHATELSLELTSRDGIRMAVRDNGAGFVPGGPRGRGCFGLASMRARAEELGGDLFVQSAPGQGTVVEVKLP